MLKFIKVSFATLLIAAVASHSQAALTASWVLDQSNLAASDGGATVNVDTYMFNVSSTEAMDATSVELDFTGSFWAIPGINAAFRANAALPEFLGSKLADSFFLGDGTQLVGSSEDTTGRLYGAWTLPGVTPIIAAGASDVTLAYLTVPTGEVPTFVSGRGSVDGAFVEIGLNGHCDCPALGGTYIGPGADLDEGLQAGFDNRNGGPILLSDAIMLENVGFGTYEDLGMISTLVEFNTGQGVTFATGTASDDDGDGKFDLMIDADWSSLAQGQLLSGVVRFEAENTPPEDSSYEASFSIRVPEPATSLLSCLAAVGLVCFARRK